MASQVHQKQVVATTVAVWTTNVYIVSAAGGQLQRASVVISLGYYGFAFRITDLHFPGISYCDENHITGTPLEGVCIHIVRRRGRAVSRLAVY